MDLTSSRSLQASLALGAIGVVFGDIGTSPLYTMNTVFEVSNGLELNPSNVVGIVSLIVWSLLIVVSLKYVTLIMRASNHGEGGIMALLALATSAVTHRPGCGTGCCWPVSSARRSSTVTGSSRQRSRS
jgi:KUP system potassium uptake protein